MINLSQLNKLIYFSIFFTVLIFNICFSEDEPADIWKKQDTNLEENNKVNEEKKATIESPILSSDENKSSISIDETELEENEDKIVGLFDPQEYELNLGMWMDSDGNDVKKIFSRINKLKLSNFSEDLLFKVLFTNAYPPKKNLSSSDFLKIKVDWLIKHRRLNDLDDFLSANTEVGEVPKAIEFLINERLSTGDIKSACEKINNISQNIENDYLEKFKIYCLINNDRKDEAQLIFELLKERGFKDAFFEDKIYFLLGLKDITDQKILDNNLFNFYLSHITNNNFEYQPEEKTDKYIWRYLSSSNLIKVDSFENEEVILTYEKASAEGSFDSEEIFNIYLNILFNVNQLINANEVYKNLPNYKARALIYQSILLADDIEKKLYFTFLLKDLFKKDKLNKAYSEEMTNILRSIDPNEIPEVYKDLVKSNIEKNYKIIKKIKFDNDILHRSKVIKHFLEDNEKISRTEKDFKSVYKKIKKNKKYFISIKDIIVLESLVVDGMSLPQGLNYEELSSELTVPLNLQNLVDQNQIGMVMLKIIEIIGEDDVQNLDPETIYFLNKILNQLNLKKIRNNILTEFLPSRV